MASDSSSETESFHLSFICIQLCRYSQMYSSCSGSQDAGDLPRIVLHDNNGKNLTKAKIVSPHEITDPDFICVVRKVGKRILRIGHLDTAFDKGSPFQTYKRDGHMVSRPRHSVRPGRRASAKKGSAARSPPLACPIGALKSCSIVRL